MEAQLRMADAVYSMKTALPTEVIKIIKMKSNRKSEEDDDDNMSVASGIFSFQFKIKLIYTPTSLHPITR